MQRSTVVVEDSLLGRTDFYISALFVVLKA
jgi:hypothetical protein